MTPEPPAATAPSVVVVARHGERLDYVLRDKGENWVAQQQADRPWDPPLSDHGFQQGTKLGRQLAEEVSQRNLPPIGAIYSSPFLRCRQTAVAALQAINEQSASSAVSTTSSSSSLPLPAPPVRVELGLAESINEKWYRSWALPGSNGTWGYRMEDQSLERRLSTDDTLLQLHEASKQPVQALFDWKTTDAAEPNHNNNNNNNSNYDYSYESKTQIEVPYCFSPSGKRLLESRKDQTTRMMQAVETVASQHAGQTVVLVSHGGPVTHLYEGLTGNKWDQHGDSSYCCYSIYQKQNNNDNDNKWQAVAVNQSSYLHEKIVTEHHV